MAPRTSMIKFAHSIYITLNGALPKVAPPMMVVTHKTILTVSWNWANFLTLLKVACPHNIDLWIDSKSLSWTIKSELSLATSQPEPIQNPTSAANSASASAIPSPVIPTIPDLPCLGSSKPSAENLEFLFSSFLLTYLDLIPLMRISLSSDVARASTLNLPFTFLNASMS